jgi:DtxR family transcriptional regulator, Mn-dependent transcriptional regulator
MLSYPSETLRLHRFFHHQLLTAHGPIRTAMLGRQTIRLILVAARLLEILMRDSLRIAIDEEMVCGIEHHMKEVFTDALCTLLNHPVQCPHGHPIPPGKCCPV